MNRYARDRSDQPHPKPVEKIELSEKHTKWRMILVVALVAFGAAALVYGFYSFLSGGDTGWREIEVNGTNTPTCSQDFIFMYNLGVSGVSVRSENNEIKSMYTEAAQKAYQIFNNDQSFDGVTNVYDINRHPNEELEVDEVLYRAFELLEENDCRYLYLAPAYAVYDNIFYCGDDSELESYDPHLNEGIKTDFQEIAAFARDASAVDLELLGENRIRLNVSEDYLDYAEENYITDFIDFYWMKNAFIADYLADTMIAGGYTLGSISSYDGFVRNLGGSAPEGASQETAGDTAGDAYVFNIYDRQGTDIFPAAVMRYSGACSIVYLRDYMMNSLDDQHYYELKNGQVRTPYLSLADGLCRSSASNLVCYSREKGCAETLMPMIPIYISDTFSGDAVRAFASDGIYSIYCEDSVICYNEEALTLTDLFDAEGVKYTTRYQR